MKRKPYWDMTRDELRQATKEFDAPFVIDKSRPLNRSERRRWQKVKRKRGRPRVGLGSLRISVSMERGLVRRVTELAKKRGLSRSRLLALVLEKEVARAGKGG
jgi:hypothetical protein